MTQTKIPDDDDIDYSDLEQKYSSHFESPLDNCVILDGVPVVGPERVEKLVGAIIKTTAKETGLKLPRTSFYLPTSPDDQSSKGFIFVTLDNPADARAFTNSMHGLAFDKKHTFSCIPFTEVDRFENLNEEWEDPKEEEWVPREHFKAWLSDPAGRDQLLVYRKELAEVVWSGRNGSQEVAFAKEHWTDSYFQWSPYGSLLGTVHAQGAAVWAGPKFDRLNRFPHPGIQLMDFSPGERFLVTWSPRPIEASSDSRFPSPFSEDDVGHHIAFWDVLTGALLRTFPMVAPPNPEHEGPKQLTWPMFKFSPDERYAARVTPGQQISVYELPSMTLLGKKSIKIQGVVDFEWSPLSQSQRDQLEIARRKGDKLPVWENSIAFWTPEVQNQPARVTLMNLPSRIMVRSKNLFNVHDCKIHWQSNGDYLCVKVDRHTKTKKTQYCNLELFRIRDKDCPVQVVELKDAVTGFAWEPKGDRFALITTNDPMHGQAPPGVLLKSVVTFYGFDSRKGDFILLKSLDPKTFNRVYWSPRGRHVILAQLGSLRDFDMEFWDLDLDRETENKNDDPGHGIRMLTNVNHFGMTEIEWDPSGRYVGTSGSTWVNALETGYTIWDFKGQELVKHSMEQFKQLLWRPRPPTLLTKEDQKKIRRNLREYSRQFEEQDQLDDFNEDAELVETRKRAIAEWNAWRQAVKEHLAALRKELGKTPEETAAKEEETELEEVEEWVEEVLSETVEVVS